MGMGDFHRHRRLWRDGPGWRVALCGADPGARRLAGAVGIACQHARNACRQRRRRRTHLSQDDGRGERPCSAGQPDCAPQDARSARATRPSTPGSRPGTAVLIVAVEPASPTSLASMPRSWRARSGIRRTAGHHSNSEALDDPTEVTRANRALHSDRIPLNPLTEFETIMLTKYPLPTRRISLALAAAACVQVFALGAEAHDPEPPAPAST